jgi:DNA-binding transcriptional ArsR family regulator
MQAAFKALSDPTRRDILSALGRGSLTAGQLADLFPISKAAMSHHFNVLKGAGLVRTERRGQSIVYSLNATVVEEVAAAILEVLDRKRKPSPRRTAKVVI